LTHPLLHLITIALRPQLLNLSRELRVFTSQEVDLVIERSHRGTALVRTLTLLLLALLVQVTHRFEEVLHQTVH
jgi:hypothetical protein